MQLKQPQLNQLQLKKNEAVSAALNYQTLSFQSPTTFANGTWLLADFSHNAHPDLIYILAPEGLKCTSLLTSNKQVASSGDQQASKQIFNADLGKQASLQVRAEIGEIRRKTAI
jgi:hypothetical protein